MRHYRQGKPWIWVEGTEEGARFVSQILAGSLVGKPENYGHDNEKD